jgi:hypothetical protein
MKNDKTKPMKVNPSELRLRVSAMRVRTGLRAGSKASLGGNFAFEIDGLPVGL